MATRLLFPDPLEWWAGLEWGVEAAAILISEGYDIECVFRSTGPMFEAVAFAALDMGILERCHFINFLEVNPSSNDIVLILRGSGGGEVVLARGGEALRIWQNERRSSLAHAQSSTRICRKPGNIALLIRSWLEDETALSSS